MEQPVARNDTDSGYFQRHQGGRLRMPHLRSKKPKATSEKASPGPSVKLRKRRLTEANLAPEQAKQSVFAIGDPVSHPQFGDGSVTAVDDGTLTIAFVDHQVRNILDYYVKRQKS
jgi:hypothetical protein